MLANIPEVQKLSVFSIGCEKPTKSEKALEKYKRRKKKIIVQIPSEVCQESQSFVRGKGNKSYPSPPLLMPNMRKMKSISRVPNKLNLNFPSESPHQENEVFRTKSKIIFRVKQHRYSQKSPPKFTKEILCHKAALSSRLRDNNMKERFARLKQSFPSYR